MFYLMLIPLFGSLRLIIGLLPQIDIQIQDNNSIIALFNMLYESSFFIPYADVLNCIGFISFYYASLTGFKGFNWIVHRIPLVG